MSWVIGDIHGCHEELEDLLAQIPSKDRLIFVGDYIDRGPASAAVVQRLLREKKRSVFLMGNHEGMLLQYFGPAKNVAWLWPGNGGLQTLESYGLKARNLRYEQIPAAHRKFYEKLRLYHEEDDFIVVHAGVRVWQGNSLAPVSIRKQQREDLLWIRLEWINEEHRWKGKKVYYGHTPTRYVRGPNDEKSPMYGKNSVGLDTGCVYGGYLTAVNTDTGDLIQVRAKHVYI